MDIYKSKYEKYKNKYLNLKLNIKSANGGAGGKPQNPTLILDQKYFPKDLVSGTFEFMTIHEIYNTCIADSKICMGINWGKVLEDKGILYENVIVTQEDIVKYGRFCPILKVPNETQKDETQKVQQKYCIIFFKYMEKLQRTDADIHNAVREWITKEEQAKERYGDIKDWNTSKVTNMCNLFKHARYFTSDLSKWDVSNVTNMSSMFLDARSFNSDLSKWDVSNVKYMTAMFHSAISFKSDLSKWDVSNVTAMNGMFYSARSFKSDLSSWNVSSVTDMSSMFEDARSFTSDLSKWNVSKVKDMKDMFSLTYMDEGLAPDWFWEHPTNDYLRSNIPAYLS